jgi:hypothetical protein
VRPIKYYSGDQIKKDEVRGACRKHGGDERSIEGIELNTQLHT